MTTTAQGADEGFTLIEVLIAITLMGFIFTAVSAAFVVSIGATAESDARLLESNAATQLSSSLSQDVQSASALSTGTPNCALPAGSTLLLAVKRYDVLLDYYFVPASSSVVRRSCTGSSSVVAREVVSPVVECLPAATCKSGVTLRMKLEGTDVTTTAVRRLP